MTKNCLNILVLAYMISPNRGSEYSVAWNYIIEMSKLHKLTILYGSSGDHLGDFEDLDEFLKNHTIENVTFHKIIPSKTAHILNFLNKKGILPYTFYFAYNIWQRQVYVYALKLLKSNTFDLIHYLNPIGYREPGYLWKINLPYIWGPISGANNFPMMLYKALSLKGFIKLFTRKCINDIQLRFNPRLKSALNKTSTLLTATSENQRLFKKYFNKDSLMLPENCINKKVNLYKSKFNNKQIHFVWIGSIEQRKALIILLDALCFIKDDNKLIIDIIGDGPDKKYLQNYSKAKKIDKIIKWHGNVERQIVFDLISNAHLNIITSLSEGNPTTIWESMSFGVPTITLDHCGMHDTICDNCGIKIPINSYDLLVNNLANNLQKLIDNPIILEKMADKTIECASHYLWDERVMLLTNIYYETIEEWNKERK